MMETMTKELMVEKASELIENKYGLDCEWDLNDNDLTFSVCYIYSEVEIFNGDISVFKSEKEFLEKLKDNMIYKFDKFSVDDEIERANNDIELYEAIQDDGREYKRIAWLIAKERNGCDTDTLNFEGKWIDELSRLGDIVQGTYNPVMIKAYSEDIGNIVSAGRLLEYIKGNKINIGIASKGVNFLNIMKRNPRINAYCVLGQYDKATKEFLETM